MERGAGGGLVVTEGGLKLPAYDYVANTSTDTTDTYRFYVGGSGGVKVATVTIVFTSTDKDTISTVTKTTP